MLVSIQRVSPTEQIPARNISALGGHFLISHFSGFQMSVWFKMMCLFIKTMTVPQPGSDSVAKIQSLNRVLLKKYFHRDGRKSCHFI